MIDTKQLDLDLDNWRRHYKDRKRYRVTLSLEGRYRPESGDVLENDLPPPSEPVNLKRAIAVEKIVTQLPHKHKLCLVTAFMYPFALIDNNFYKFCRVAAIRPSEYEDYLKRAKLMVRNKL